VKLCHTAVTISAVLLFVSFFLPWITILGAGLSGLDVQRDFEAYRHIWLMPILAVITVIINIAGLNALWIRRFAGLCPITILIYAIFNLGSGILNEIQIGGWLALLFGLALVLIPSKPKLTAVT
jgi:hypothetical protein